ncbi:MAG: glucosaminidase domain-containing protein [Tannerella sp.]|nr:glucosaminidase domain-containing protein [Tannerella sp.]
MEQVENATQQESSSLEDSIYNFIKNMNIAHPDIAFAMAKLESANFTSKIFREQNNLFGMRESFKRPYIRDSVVNGYSSYANWKESIIDYALWQTYSAKNMERNAFLQLLQQTYAEDSTYIQTINKLIKNNN